MSYEKDMVDTTNWKQMCQDQTDLVNKAQGQVRILEKRLADKDEAHKKLTDHYASLVNDLRAEVQRVAAGQGTVPQHVFDAVGTKLEKVTAKLAATQKYAEAQRKATIAVTAKYQALNDAVDNFATATIMALEPLLAMVQPPVPPAPLTLCGTLPLPAQVEVTQCGPAVLPNEAIQNPVQPALPNEAVQA